MLSVLSGPQNSISTKISQLQKLPKQNSGRTRRVAPASRWGSGGFSRSLRRPRGFGARGGSAARAARGRVAREGARPDLGARRASCHREPEEAKRGPRAALRFVFFSVVEEVIVLRHDTVSFYTPEQWRHLQGGEEGEKARHKLDLRGLETKEYERSQSRERKKSWGNNGSWVLHHALLMSPALPAHCTGDAAMNEMDTHIWWHEDLILVFYKYPGYFAQWRKEWSRNILPTILHWVQLASTSKLCSRITSCMKLPFDEATCV
ncbi:uncharacterized protein WM277_015347 [Molossus nigricans]